MFQESNILSYIMLFLVGCMKGFSDILQFNYSTSIFNGLNDLYYNPQLSWRNKYKMPLINTTTKKWYYLWLYKPKYEEKFPYSTTCLVSFTDGWHFFQAQMLAYIFLAVLFHSNLKMLDGIGLFSLILGFWVTFENKLLNYK